MKLELGRSSARRNRLKPVVLNVICNLSDERGEVFILGLKLPRTRIFRQAGGDTVKIWMTAAELAELHTELGKTGILAGLSDLNEGESW